MLRTSTEGGEGEGVVEEEEEEDDEKHMAEQPRMEWQRRKEERNNATAEDGIRNSPRCRLCRRLR